MKIISIILIGVITSYLTASTVSAALFKNKYLFKQRIRMLCAFILGIISTLLFFL